MIVDANVLIYAVDSTAHFHEPAVDWMNRALNGPTRIGLPWVSLLAFQRIVTHPRIPGQRLTPSQAWSFIADWLAAEPTWTPHPGPHHAAVLERLIVDGDLRGNLVTDAHLAALAIENGVGLCSFDSDFARFPELHWENPAHVTQ
jgi:toxin-antitoxin system PIN domain toxin